MEHRKRSSIFCLKTRLGILFVPSFHIIARIAGVLESLTTVFTLVSRGLHSQTNLWIFSFFSMTSNYLIYVWIMHFLPPLPYCQSSCFLFVKRLSVCLKWMCVCMCMCVCAGECVYLWLVHCFDWSSLDIQEVTISSSRLFKFPLPGPTDLVKRQPLTKCTDGRQ